MRKRNNRAVLVVGGGIAGIQASIDLGNMGFKVYLVEKSPSIGGRMAQLDKTFPTNDCSICILAPKMIECASHPNVNLLTYSEIQEVKGNLGDFSVKVLRKARFVDEELCTGCGDCAAKCPAKVKDEFDMGLRQRRAAYLPFLQAIPRVYTIDREHCIYLLKGKCGLCRDVCQAGAIDFEQKDKVRKLKVAAIVLATGFDPYDISSLKEYGYGSAANVITALQFERMLSASGPTNGSIRRPSDDKPPGRLAFIQCVGSRDERSRPYCSAVCCMHATKEAMLAREHHPDLESFIFYTDLRAVGKRFQEYVTRAKDECRVTYIRARPGAVLEESDTENPTIQYEETTAREVKKMEVDMVILCQALVPSDGNGEIAQKLGIGLDDYGFVKIPDRLNYPVDTGVSGIFACGFCQNPQDIPDSVIQASGAAARVAECVMGNGSEKGSKRQDVRCQTQDPGSETQSPLRTTQNT